MIRIAVLLTLAALTGCTDIDLGGKPGPDVRKEQGPLTVPPPGVWSGRSM